MTDGHYASYQEMLDKVEWDKYGVVNGVARDRRCENCMVHCGYEPTASLGPQRAARRHVEEHQIQFRSEAQADSAKATRSRPTTA